MKVLFLSTHVFSQSGSSYAMRETIRRVAKNGVDPLVVVPDSPDSRELFSSAEFHVFFIRMARLRNVLNPFVHISYLLSLIPLIFRLLQIIRSQGVELVHFNEINDIVAGVAARLCGVPCVCHIRADGLPAVQQRVFLWILKRLVKTIVVPSESTGNWVRSGLADGGPDVQVVYDHAFDASEYDPSLSGDRVREELGISSASCLVLLVSKLRIKKGHVCFIRAAEQLSDEHPEMVFVIVGDALNGHEAEAAEIQEIGRALGAKRQLFFLGIRRDLPNIYAAADIVVHCPTYPDPYPTVVLLGMIMGKPVVGSDIGGITEQLDGKNSGVLVPPDNSTALAEALLMLFGSPERRKELSEGARRRALDLFAPGTQARHLLTIYRRILDSRSPTF